MSIWGSGETEHFYQLTPHQILDAIESIGFKPTGRCLPLNSLENRVYEIELESGESIITKFYRPGRWTKEQILEELSFIRELYDAELPVVPPLILDSNILFTCAETKILFSVFEKKGGRLKDELNEDEISLIGRTIARLHIVGEQKKSDHRLTLDIATFGHQSVKILERPDSLVPNSIKEYFLKTLNDILGHIDSKYKPIKLQRIHGDLHVGNILWRDHEPLIVDFDDFLIGPPVQDLWTLLPGDDEEAKGRQDIFMDNYSIMKEFPYEQLSLVPYLKILRQIHFNAWISKRWSDPAFKQIFSHCQSDYYWEEQYLDMRNFYASLTQPSYQGDDFNY
jgi:Ser/Thr protein kinase RdoA (MazF antagonist)